MAAATELAGKRRKIPENSLNDTFTRDSFSATMVIRFLILGLREKAAPYSVLCGEAGKGKEGLWTIGGSMP